MNLKVLERILNRKDIPDDVKEDLKDFITHTRTLRQEEEKFRRLFINAPLPYQSLDIDGNFIEINDQWLKLLGYERDEVLGKNFLDFLVSSDYEKFYERFPRLKEDGVCRGVDFELLTKNGESVFVTLDGRVIYDDQGKFKRTQCILTDVTEIIRAEETRSKLEKQRIRFIETTTHELRVPLTNIRGFFYVLMNYPEGSEAEKKHIYDIIERNLTRLERLIEDVSDLSRIERGETIQIEKEITPFCLFMHDQATIYQKRLLEQFKYRSQGCYGSSVMVEFDQGRIQQVLDNLVNNSIKYTNIESRRISMKVLALTESVQVIVEDNGAGIEVTNLERIFEPFTSIPTHISVKGTGLGLFLSRMIIENHGGSIWVSSEGIGKGAQFIMEFPRYYPLENP